MLLPVIILLIIANLGQKESDEPETKNLTSILHIVAGNLC